MKMRQNIFHISFNYFVLAFNIYHMVLVHSINSSIGVNNSWHIWSIDDSYYTYGQGKITAKVLLSSYEGYNTKCLSYLPWFGFGFISTDSMSQEVHEYVLGIFLYNYYNDTVSQAVVVWYANGDDLVGGNASLNLTAAGDLVLRDGDGKYVWSTNTSGLSVRSMNLSCEGNLVLQNDTGGIVWQSFDYPRNTLLTGQILDEGQRLTSVNSSTNFSRGLFYVIMEEDGIYGYVDTTTPTQYVGGIQIGDTGFDHPYDSQYNYVRLEADGHLYRYIHNYSDYVAKDLLEGAIGGDVCAYPATCGSYGVCTSNEGCSCPLNIHASLNYFRPTDFYNINQGCTPLTPLTCSSKHKLHTFLKLDNVTYFRFESSIVGVMDVDSCRQACLENCSCKAALFRYHDNGFIGNCSLPTEILTLSRVGSKGYNSIAFIKVQKSNNTSAMIIKLVSSLSAGLLFMLLCASCAYYVVLGQKSTRNNENPVDVVIDTITRFSYESLRLATREFDNRLGRGGFGSVFEGLLQDGTKVAVKRLESIGQGRKEFLAEVNSIGNLHHFNLVRLIGFCDDGLHRLLVYEYMPNGSLDKWIFNQDRAEALAWGVRQKIICGIAKGLEYLHENCIQNIIHFDIKPQNILLDKNFDVKIADFGLAKMVDRDQSQIITIIKGTPGYIAPELISGEAISVKVDVYSFGVLVLEIVCGRKNFGSSDSDCLTKLVKVKADEDRLSDLIDNRSEDAQQHIEEAEKMLKIAIWCLQPHFIRPTMSMVVKVLQDLPNMEILGDLSYLTMLQETTPMEGNSSFSVRPSESILSGPR